MSPPSTSPDALDHAEHEPLSWGEWQRLQEARRDQEEATIRRSEAEAAERQERAKDPYGHLRKVEERVRAEVEEEERAVRIQAALGELKSVSEDPECMARLHEIERMMVLDVLAENRHLKCNGCLHWMTKLARKARGEEWRDL